MRVASPSPFILGVISPTPITRGVDAQESHAPSAALGTLPLLGLWEAELAELVRRRERKLPVNEDRPVEIGGHGFSSSIWPTE